MVITAEEIRELFGGEIEGDPNAEIFTVSKIEQGSKGALTFLANPKYEQYLYETKATAVLISKSFIPAKEVNLTMIKVDDPYIAFTQVLGKYFNPDQHKTGIEQPCYIAENSKIGATPYIGAFAYIGKNVTIGDNVKIYPNAYIGDNVHIGDNTVLFAGVKIYSYCVIGSNCILHAGTVIGSDGFGFAPQADGTYAKIPQTGNVIIEDNVEIGSNCSIDRATMGSTIIKKGAKLDNLVQIAHNVEIGENTAIAAQTGIAGSTKLGKHCVVAGQVGFAGHLQIADGSQFGAQAGIGKNITEKNKQWHGSPAIDLKGWLKAQVLFRNLPNLEKKIDRLEKAVTQQANQISKEQ
jgi:UDP-3-O-[3-hydroxymyristoyl] glucosamine N-acyltransferase